MAGVPFYSQHAEDVPPEWRSRACGVMALRMALEHFGVKVSPKELIEEGVASGAYHQGLGWKHDGLVALAKKFGVNASRQEFKNDPNAGSISLREALAAGRVPIVSVRVDGMKDTHLIPLVGASTEGFQYHDPALDSATGVNLFISDDDFLRRWRGLAIFVG